MDHVRAFKFIIISHLGLIPLIKKSSGGCVPNKVFAFGGLSNSERCLQNLLVVFYRRSAGRDTVLGPHTKFSEEALLKRDLLLLMHTAVYIGNIFR